jgi:hypothetical protein
VRVWVLQSAAENGAMNQTVVEVKDLELKTHGRDVIETPVMSCSFGVPGENPVILYSDPMKLAEHMQQDHGIDAVLGFAGLSEFCRIASESLDRIPPLRLPRSIGAVTDAAPDAKTKDVLRKCFFASSAGVQSSRGWNSFGSDVISAQLLR